MVTGPRGTRMAKEDPMEQSKPIEAVFPSLAGKTAVISGASRGIGCGIARVLGRQKMRLVLTARSEEKGLAFTKELTDDGIEAHWITADLSQRDEAERVIREAIETYGAVDLLVNNAAQLHSKPFLDLDEEWYQKSLIQNLDMIYGPSRFAVQHMAERGGGVIIHISSVGATRAHRGLSGYDASKGAINALTQCMAVDLAPYGIRVNAVSPGATLRGPVPEQYRERVAKKAAGIPLGRMGESEEIGAAVAFLASDAAAYITGENLHVDGGLVAQLTPPGIFI